MKTASDPRARRALDRWAEFLAPPVEALGEPGQVTASLFLVLFISLGAAALVQVWAASAPDDTQAALFRASPGLVWLLAVVSPVGATLKGAFLTAIAWAVLVLLGGAPRIRPILTATLYGECILGLQALWVGAFLAFQGAPSPEPGRLLPIPSGLDLVLLPTSAAGRVLVHHLSLFHLAWAAFLVLALSRHGGVTRGKGAVTTLALWALVAGMSLLRGGTP